MTRWLNGAAANPVFRRDRVHGGLRAPAVGPQLQPADRRAGARRALFGHVLSPYAYLCAAQYPSAIPPLHHCPLRDLCRRRGEYRAVAFRLVPGASLLGVDVLELGGDHATHGGVHLFRDTSNANSEKIVRAAELCRFPV